MKVLHDRIQFDLPAFGIGTGRSPAGTRDHKGERAGRETCNRNPGFMRLWFRLKITGEPRNFSANRPPLLSP